MIPSDEVELPPSEEEEEEDGATEDERDDVVELATDRVTAGFSEMILWSAASSLCTKNTVAPC